MMKQKQTNFQPSNYEWTTLIICTGIIVAFCLFVAIATKGSLSYYTIPHAALALVIIATLFFINKLPKIALRALIFFGIVGAVLAIGLTLAYLPYYSQYLEHLNTTN